jgi:hypothetical protein
MTADDFQAIVSEDPGLLIALRHAAAAAPARQQFGVTEAVLIALMFPIAQFVVTQMGLPWLYEAGRYSELWRLKFHRWLDEEYHAGGFHPEQAEAAGERLREELQRTTDAHARAAWERLRDRMLGGKGRTGEKAN